MELCTPLPVYDFGNGRLTLTDGHSRAFIAYQYNLKIPIIYDTDDIVICKEGQLLYKNDINWCQRFNIHTVADLESRIVDSTDYQYLWIERCNRAYNLLTKVNENERIQIEIQYTEEIKALSQGERNRNTEQICIGRNPADQSNWV